VSAPCDLIVIGGGSTGRGWARDAVGKGLGAKLLLREREDTHIAEPVLWRRRRLGLHMTAGEQAGLAACLGS